MMKRLYNYLVINLLLVLLVSCGTDPEPEIFPNRSVGEVESFPISDMVSDPSQCKRIFVSEDEVYFYLSTYDESMSELAAYDLQTGTKREVSLSVDGDDEFYSRSAELQILLSGLQTRSSSSPVNSCWLNGKGYVVGTEYTYIYSKDTDVWSFVQNDGSIDYFDPYNASNAVAVGDLMVQITSSDMYTLSLTDYRWNKLPMTHDFMLNGKSKLYTDGEAIYALDRKERLLYVYNGESNLWKEYMSIDNQIFPDETIGDILINGDTYYLFLNYSFYILEYNLKNKSYTIINTDALASNFFYGEWEQYYLFNVGNTCYGLFFDGSGARLMKFNLK